MKKKRCFTAVNLPEKLKQKIFDWRESYKDKFENAKWVEKQNFHITMHFLGYLEKQEIEKVGEVLDEIKKADPINIKIGKVDCFPKPSRATVLFLHAKENGLLKEIQERVGKDIAKKIDFELEDRPWVSHITIARFRNQKNVNLDSFEEIQGEFLAKSIDLMESKLSRKGPEYSILKKYNFSNK